MASGPLVQDTSSRPEDVEHVPWLALMGRHVALNGTYMQTLGLRLLDQDHRIVKAVAAEHLSPQLPLVLVVCTVA